MDNIQAVTQLIERSHEYHLPLVLVFVDYKKAFDSVEVNAVLNALTQAGVLPAYIHLLEQCFTNTSTNIQLFDRKMKIPIEKGVRQGDTDIVLVSTNTAEMEEMINELNVVGLKIGLEMNMSKTQMMVNQWSDMGEIKLAGRALERV
ncbi:hypothetical protein OSTOST_02545 [Ostertagia ostertagi]